MKSIYPLIPPSFIKCRAKGEEQQLRWCRKPSGHYSKQNSRCETGPVASKPPSFQVYEGQNLTNLLRSWEAEPSRPPNIQSYESSYEGLKLSVCRWSCDKLPKFLCIELWRFKVVCLPFPSGFAYVSIWFRSLFFNGRLVAANFCKCAATFLLHLTADFYMKRTIWFKKCAKWLHRYLHNTSLAHIHTN